LEKEPSFPKTELMAPMKLKLYLRKAALSGRSMGGLGGHSPRNFLGAFIGPPTFLER